MANISVPNADPLTYPTVSAPSSGNGAGVEALEGGDTSTSVDVAAFTVLAYPDYSGIGGGGSVRPASGQVYPRGT